MQTSGFPLKNWHSIHVVHFSGYLHLFSRASSSLKSCFGKKACECQCLSSLCVNNILYFSLFFSFPCPLWRKKSFHFDFAVRYCGPPACADTVANQIHIISRFLSLSLISYSIKGNYGWGRAERCFWNSRDSIHTSWFVGNSGSKLFSGLMWWDFPL